MVYSIAACVQQPIHLSSLLNRTVTVVIDGARRSTGRCVLIDKCKPNEIHYHNLETTALYALFIHFIENNRLKMQTYIFQRNMYVYKYMRMYACFSFAKYNCTPLSNKRSLGGFSLNHTQTYTVVTQLYNIFEILHADIDTLYVFK